MTVKGNGHFYLIADRAVGHGKDSTEMYARLVGSTENHIAQHCLLQERGWHLTAEVLLAEVTPEKTRGSMIDIHIYDVVIIHIVYTHSVFIISTLSTL